MGLTQRQISCFKHNEQFLSEVSAAMLLIAVKMYREALIIENKPDATEVEKVFSSKKRQIAEQTFSEQGINLSGIGGVIPGTTGIRGNVAMQNIVHQMLMSEDWTMSPDEWAKDEMTARGIIQFALGALMDGFTSIPQGEQNHG